MTAGLFAPDGCVRPNISTNEYRVTLAPLCEHDTVRAAEITVRAESATDAEQYANEWVRHGVMKRTYVVGVREETS